MKLARELFAITLAAVAAGAGDVLAQARITGTVRDSTGAAVAGAEVFVQGTSRTSSTDRDGAFRISGLAVGTSVIGVRKLGFAPTSTVMRLVDGDNQLPDIVLIASPVQLDTVATREQQLWREYPLLREFEENRRVGLGQFVTRAQLEQQKGGFLSPVVSQMRGLVVVRSMSVGSKLWLGNLYVPTFGTCTELEDRNGANITPPLANCNYCFPDVYLDRHKLSRAKEAVNVGQFHPDMLQAVEIYLGPAETPIRYASGATSCGVIVFHSRVHEDKPRIVARAQEGPTRSRVFGNVSASTGHYGGSCIRCGQASGVDAMLGYTLKDRWVVGGRFGKWTGTTNGPQSMTMQQAVVEWYPHPDPGRFKWFVNAGVGTMSVSVVSAPRFDIRDSYRGRLPTISAGTGMDVALRTRITLSPFLAYTRTLSGTASQNRCMSYGGSTPTTACNELPAQPRLFTLPRAGLRLGWR
jgi:hypothetical protein